ncbi:hypothetical protein Nepgr_031957 [Nepenthes gracilis]|uniref:Aminotransferase-like plant mobile domain-containing protein n=1 Tax=Nepenthes gracilis TaxID=150966 RepID=A0AAD3TJ31_NEPGR|nr:hypothetical protein Nepgr_031957 [Nepenthes gracilis]
MKRTTRRSSVDVEEKRNSVGNFSTKFSMPSFIRRVDKLTADQRMAIKRTGFGNLLHIHNQLLCKNLLVELMERWDCGKQAFMLPPAEITITPMDVSLILGLRSIGIPVALDENEPFSDLEKEYGAATWNRKISITVIEERLESLGGLANEDFVRAFLLFTFGTFLFPNSNGKVDSRYLSLLEDLNKVCEFAWGAAVLEDIFYWLCRRKEKRIQYVGGCLILIQIWSYEHIETGRPNMVDRYLKFPRACRWESSRSSNQRQWYTNKFNELEENQITWALQLTRAELEIDIIRELLEAESAGQEQVLVVESSTSSPLDGTGSVNAPPTIMKELVKLEDEAAMDENTSAGLGASRDMPVVSVSCTDAPSVSCYLPDIQEEQEIEHSSSSTEPSLNSYFSNENCVEAESRGTLEEEILELKKQVSELRKENAMLQNQISSDAILQEENARLRKEIDDLKRENKRVSSSSCGLVARLERILEEAQDAADEAVDPL